jgi:S1-C subfamily serine protease
VISAVNRSVNVQNDVPFHGLLQTDALINPGNSGGPLLNAEGRLIGINVAIWGGAQGIGFAIPIDTAKRVIRELLLYGEVQPVWLGLEFKEIDPSLRSLLELPNGAHGVLINRVQASSPAARAGIRRGDIVLGIDDRRVKNASSLNEMFKSMTDGQPIAFELFNDGETRNVTARAEEMPAAVVSNIAHSMLGLDLELSEMDAAFEITSVRSGSGAEALGLREGDFLIKVNGVVLTDHEALRRAIARLRGNPRALVVVQRGPGRYHLTIPLQ